MKRSIKTNKAPHRSSNAAMAEFIRYLQTGTSETLLRIAEEVAAEGVPRQARAVGIRAMTGGETLWG
jgi:hypothetical protein